MNQAVNLTIITREHSFILNFLTQYKLWVLAGVPKQNRYGFSAMDGLCINLSNYCYVVFHPLFPKSEVYEIIEDAHGFLTAMFRKDGLCESYPFGGEEQFSMDVDAKSHHLDADRLEWIRLKLELPRKTNVAEVVMEGGVINQFLTQYKLWVLAGAREQDNPYNFTTTTGLCGNLARYTNKVFACIADHHLFVDAALAEFTGMFQVDGLGAEYPFGRDEYLDDLCNFSFHLNPVRMAWVDRQLGAV